MAITKTSDKAVDLTLTKPTSLGLTLLGWRVDQSKCAVRPQGMQETWEWATCKAPRLKDNLHMAEYLFTRITPTPPHPPSIPLFLRNIEHVSARGDRTLSTTFPHTDLVGCPDASVLVQWVRCAAPIMWVVSKIIMRLLWVIQNILKYVKATQIK